MAAAIASTPAAPPTAAGSADLADHRPEQWDPTAKVTYDRALWNELVSLRFIAAHAHVAIVGPVGVGKTFLAHALGWLACRQALMLRGARHRSTCGCSPC